MVATVIAMVALDWRLTVVSLLLLPFFVWISRRVGNERKKITTERQKQLAAMSAIVQESLSVSGILLGRTMGRSTCADRRSSPASRDDLVDLEVRASMAGRWRQSTIQIVMAAMPAVIYWAAGLTSARRPPARLDRHPGRLHYAAAEPVPPDGQPAARPASTCRARWRCSSRIFEYLDLPPDIDGARRAA